MLMALLLMACVEPFELSVDNFEEVLIVEATITNSTDNHTVKISTTSVLGSSGTVAVENATVWVMEDDRMLSFSETSPGEYRSEIAFQAVPNADYQLFIQTDSGVTLTSEKVRLSTESSIGSVIADKIINEDGIEGMNITVNSFDPTGESRYYRYSFEETYKIVAPRWSRFETYVVSEDPVVVDIRLRPREEQVCFRTLNSSKSLLFETTNQAEDRVASLPIRFIERSDYIIAHRYSILVKQFVQTREAFEYYNTLQRLSSQENLLSQNQPGFVLGNITADQNNTKVTGYFDIAAVGTERIFFNYDDFFDDITEPNYAVGCDVFLYPLVAEDQFGNSPLVVAIENENLEFFNDNPPPRPNNQGPFVMVPTICGDCNIIGTNVVPEFWVD